MHRLWRQPHRRVAKRGRDNRRRLLSGNPPPNQVSPGPWRPHVDRPQVEARRCRSPSGPNRPKALDQNSPATAEEPTGQPATDRFAWKNESTAAAAAHHRAGEADAPHTRDTSDPDPHSTGSGPVARWPSRGRNTRSHPELGRETPQRPWYCSPSCGSPVAAGPPGRIHTHHHTDAGWSSPVARQAHNLKAAGSNPAPAPSSAEQPNHALTPQRRRISPDRRSARRRNRSKATRRRGWPLEASSSRHAHQRCSR